MISLISLWDCLNVHIDNLSRPFLLRNEVDMELTGPIPSEIGMIDNLIALGISGNEIQGKFPTQLFNLNLTNMNFGEKDGPVWIFENIHEQQCILILFSFFLFNSYCLLQNK